MQPLQFELRLPSDSIDSLESFLESRPRIRQDAALRQSVTLYDTFDWRLYKSGALLRVTPSKRGFTWSWCDLDGTLRQEIWEAAAPGLLSTLTHPELRRSLAPIVAMRRLLPVAKLDYRVTPMRLVDGEEKTRVRLSLRRGIAQPGTAMELGATSDADASMSTVLQLQGLRGYGKDLDRLHRSLIGELGCQPSDIDEMRRALDAVSSKRTPGDYSSKPRLEIEPAMPAADAARSIHRVLLRTILRNESGLRSDVDSEFLHDFRVSVRRTRSALSQIKRVFPEEPLAHFRKEFSWLGSLTGPTRDLDVYLLKMDDYRKLLPASVSQDLDPLVDFLVTKQRREHKRLVAGLDSPRYRLLIDDWRTFLESPPAIPEGQAPNADQPIVHLANRRIWRLYRRVVKDGQQILSMASDPEAHAEALHDLRIECKKLRYCMEFFRALYPSKEIDPLIRAFKKLQDNLGDFNDYEVQRLKMAELADEMMPRKSASAATMLAMGRLVAFLDEAQEKERLSFEVRFLTFMEPHRQASFKALFKSA